MSIKIAIGGKGGVGKTTIAALLARTLACRKEKDIIAVDADPVSNLPSLLGFSDDQPLTPIAELADLIEERTGARPDAVGSYFSLNPKVDDIPEKFSLQEGRIKALVLGTIKNAGAGCICPASALLKSLMVHLVLGRDELVIMDMEAGIEHLGRATAAGVDVFLIVANPGRRSLVAAQKILTLTRELGIDHVFVLANRIKNSADRALIQKQLPDAEIIAQIGESDEVEAADREGRVPFGDPETIEEGVVLLAEKLLALEP